MTAGWHAGNRLLAALACWRWRGAGPARLLAGDEDVAVERSYVKTPDAPRGQTPGRGRRQERGLHLLPQRL